MQGKTIRMALTAVDRTLGKKGPPAKIQSHLEFDSNKVAAATKPTTEPQKSPNHAIGSLLQKKQRLLFPRHGGKKLKEGRDNNAAMVTDAGPEATTPRQGSLLPASCRWAESRAQEQKDGIALATQGKERGGKEDAIPEVETPATNADSPLPRTSLKSKFNKLVLDGVHIAITGSFTQPDNNKFSGLGPAYNLYTGKKYIRQLIISHGARYNDSVYPNTNFLLVGKWPAKTMVERAVSKGVWQVFYNTIKNIIYGRQSIAEARKGPDPNILTEGQDLEPPTIQQDAGMLDEGEEELNDILFTKLKSKKRKDPSDTPKKVNLAPGTEVIRPRGVINTTRLPKKKMPKHISIIQVTLQVPWGIVKDLVMELMFSGLDTIRTDAKTVCFVYPTNPEQYAKKRQDMPGKFQKIHKEWAEFDQPILHFKNNIKAGRKRTYNLSIWLSSEKPTKTILDACELEWDEERENGGLVKFSYKHMQSLLTSQNLMLIGVPTDVEAEGLQMKMQEKMEEAHLKMIDRNQFRYGTIVKVPKFVLEKDFIKNMPYAERSDKDNIPGWAQMPFQLKCVATDEDHLDQILAYMYSSKPSQGLFGETAFYYRNPGTDASVGERNVLAGILMRHIAMVRTMGRVYIRGLQHPDRVFPIVKYEDKEPGEVSFGVNRLVREIMMEKKIHGTKVWTLLAQTADGHWAGYYQFSIGNKGHKNLAMEWYASLSVHIRFHLIG